MVGNGLYVCMFSIRDFTNLMIFASSAWKALVSRAKSEAIRMLILDFNQPLFSLRFSLFSICMM